MGYVAPSTSAVMTSTSTYGSHGGYMQSSGSHGGYQNYGIQLNPGEYIVPGSMREVPATEAKPETSGAKVPTSTKPVNHSAEVRKKVNGCDNADCPCGPECQCDQCTCGARVPAAMLAEAERYRAKLPTDLVAMRDERNKFQVPQFAGELLAAK